MEEVKNAGEKLFYYIYSGNRKADTISLDEHRFNMFKSSIAKNTQKLESLPPTSTAAKFHSYRVYLQIQNWKIDENKYVLKNPEDWGWEKKMEFYSQYELLYNQLQIPF